MNEREVKDKARELLKPFCRVCPECNGVACRGEVPGMGGKGSGLAFINNYKRLKGIELKMRVIHDIKEADTACELFGMAMALPVYAAPVTGTVFNMGGKLTELEYIRNVIVGCHEAGIIPMVGDSALPSFLTDNLAVLKEIKKSGIAFIKPWPNEEILQRVDSAMDSGVGAIGVDVDACGLVTLNIHGKGVYPKSPAEIKELKDSIKVPFIVKGVLTLADAEAAYNAGADAIVVSNHGGRVLDCAQASCDALVEIADAYKGKLTILVDGGVRDGIDVFKMLALGADGVLIGRPFVTYSFGGGADAVRDYVLKVKSELKGAMLLTGARSLKDIDRSMIVVHN